MTDGAALRRLLGFLGFAAGAVVPPLALGALPLPNCYGCREPERWRPPYCPAPVIMPLSNWTPTVDPRVSDEEGTCLPAGESGGGRELIDAPKPPGFDPLAQPDPFHACMQVGPAGDVQAVRLSSRSAASGNRVKETIATWRFAASPGTSEWVRVRLDSRHSAPAGVP